MKSLLCRNKDSHRKTKIVAGASNSSARDTGRKEPGSHWSASSAQPSSISQGETPSSDLYPHTYMCAHLCIHNTHTYTHKHIPQHAIPAHHGVSHVPVCTLDESVSHFFPSPQFHHFSPPPIWQEFYCHGTESSIMLMKSIKRLLELASLCTEFLSVSCSLSCLTPSSSVTPVYL